MSTLMTPDSFIKGPAYALVIGISEHEHGVKPKKGLVLGDEEFPNLRLAHKDARDFADVLRHDVGLQDSCIDVLQNKDATLEAIRESLENLRVNCKKADDPLVIVYFAGHGWVDEAKRHFLVPHDARRDQLYRTGLRNREFRDLLGELKANRLVVFIDACHSGAVVEGDDSRAMRGEPYSPETDLNGGDDRFVIASCRPTQLSYEWVEKENGIFTFHLIELLKGEAEEIGQDNITPITLIEPLRDRVLETAKRLKKTQEPYFAVDGGTSGNIVLAVNKRKLRLKREADEKRRAYARTQRDSINKKNSDQRFMVAKMVSDYVPSGRKELDEKYTIFYGLVDGFVSRWLKGNEGEIERWSDHLIESYEEAGTAAVMDSRLQVQPGRGADQFVAARTQSTGAPSNGPTTVSSPERPQNRLQLHAEDRDYVVAELGANSFETQANVIKGLLFQPVSQQEVDATIAFIKNAALEDKSLAILLRDVKSRFDERWSKVETARAGTLIADKNKDA